MNRDLWIYLFFLGGLFFSWPLLDIFKASLPLYLFTVWIVFIGLLFFASKRTGRKDGGG
ncbi:MAG: hypothetical protein M0042_02585 [Nitrospiraceae bacterium]|nr:hypothetical protein [Nitrospiraceae bacterium]